MIFYSTLKRFIYEVTTLIIHSNFSRGNYVGAWESNLGLVRWTYIKQPHSHFDGGVLKVLVLWSLFNATSFWLASVKPLVCINVSNFDVKRFIINFKIIFSCHSCKKPFFSIRSNFPKILAFAIFTFATKIKSFIIMELELSLLN